MLLPFLSRRRIRDRWCASWYDPAKRQTRRESLGTSEFKAAQIELAKFVTIKAERRREHPADAMLDDVFVRYYEKHARHIRSAPETRHYLALLLETLPDVSVADLTQERQSEAVRKLRAAGYAAGTIKRAIGVAKAAVNFL